MTYDALERSRDAGAPVEAFRFVLGGQVWRFALSDRVETLLGETYLPEPGMQREGLEIGAEGPQAGSVSLPVTNPLVQLLLPGSPIEKVTCTGYRWHRGDPTDVVGLPPMQVSGSDYDGETGLVKLSLNSVAQLLELEIPNLPIQRTCPYALYHLSREGQGCGVNRAAFTDAATVFAASGTLVTLTVVTPRPDGWYTAGELVGPNGQHYAVTRHSGAVLELLTPAGADLVAGAPVEVAAGCDRRPTTCDTKFGNVLRCGAWPDLPDTNPFTDGV